MSIYEQRKIKRANGTLYPDFEAVSAPGAQPTKPRYETQVKFLTHIYDDSVQDIAAILAAQAAGDTKTLWNYLHQVKDFIEGLMMEME